MKSIIQKHTGCVFAMIALFMALPEIYFFTGSLLKYKMNRLNNSDIFVPHPAVMIEGLLFAIVFKKIE